MPFGDYGDHPTIKLKDGTMDSPLWAGFPMVAGTYKPDPMDSLVAAARAIVYARNAGADVYEARTEVDALEHALAVLDGIVGKVCGNCHQPWEPHHLHWDKIVWIDQ